MAYAPATGFSPVAVIVCVNGFPLSAALSVMRGCSSETVMPCLASVAACFTLAGVIRLTVPRWSSLPQRPQLESWVIQRSKSALVALCEVCPKPAHVSIRPDARAVIRSFILFTRPERQQDIAAHAARALVAR